METMTQESTLHGLASAYGVQPEWRDIWGNAHTVTEDMRRALLSAMSVKVDSQSDIDTAFDELAHATVARWLEPVMVLAEPNRVNIPIRLPESLHSGSFAWQLIREDGESRDGNFVVEHLEQTGQVELATHSQKINIYQLEMDVSWLHQGYHRFTIQEAASGQEVDLRLIVTPARCYLPFILEPGESQERASKVWGPAVQLYALHSNRNWGMGDFTDLGSLVDWCATQGAALIGLNPLHALFPHNPAHASPYSPSSRIFFNIMYLDVEAISDFSESDEVRRMLLSPDFRSMLERLRNEPLVAYAEIGRCKLEALSLLYQDFCRNHLAHHTERAVAFRQYLAEQGRPLEMFALFHALQERFHKEDPSVWGWPAWPESYRHPDSPAVREFLETNREQVGFYQYLQWQTDLQLAAVGKRCLKSNLGIGLYMDMAVGVDRGGADVWANQRLFADSCTVGAPPDEYNQLGQDWGLPPLIPERMREEAYETFIAILRQNMKYAGALRLDHVMGLLRLFWIPPGFPPSQGAYIHYPVEELFGILALESQRNQCMVIGEDMGTVPDAVREAMERWGVYSYKVFYFEKDENNACKLPENYLDRAAVAISTHDLPTLSGFWQGRDITVRTELNLYPNKELREKQIHDRVMERMAILNRLEEQDLLPAELTAGSLSAPVMSPELAEAIHRLVARTQSKVFMVQFEDMLQQVEQINLPGTTDPVYPCWKRKLEIPLETLFQDSRVLAISKGILMERPCPVAITTPAEDDRKKK